MTSAAETYGHEHYDSKFELRVVVLCSMAGVLMQALDTTIANVALPSMMGDLSASRDQITWVLTSYIVAAAVMTAPVGWVAARFGKKNVLIASMLGFTIASMMCGMAQNLTEMIVFRLLQGVFGAALAPLSQTVMLDLYPPEKRGQAMAIFGMGIMLGPILGPMLGGWLTDTYSWRWVFYVNVPFGVAASVGLLLFFKDSVHNALLKFDWFGFAAMAMGVGALQLMLDRGTTKDWFSAPEIILECVLAGLGFYLFIVHLLTTKSSFIQRGIFTDRNFMSAQVVMFVVGAVLLASTALLPPYLQTLSGHTVTETGLLLGPRGLGTIVAMIIVGRISNHVDPRILMTIGTAAMTWSLWEMSRWTPSIDNYHLLFTTIVQGFGLGMVFSPLQLVAFATMPGKLRPDGTSLMNLVRNIGSAIGISVTTTLLSDSMQAIHSQLTAFATPFNRALGVNAPSMLYNLSLPTGRAALNGAIQIRAAIEAYANDFLFMFYVALITFPLIWLMQRPAYSSSGNGKAGGSRGDTGMIRTAFIGLGATGYPMAGHLVRLGNQVTVFNRTREKAQHWVAEHGGRIAGSPAEAVVGADVVMACVGRDADLRAVTVGEGGAFAAMEKRAVFVDHTTASATIARELGEAAEKGGFGFMDAPVSGGEQGAKNGQLTVMCGGSEADYAKVEPVIAAYAKQSRRMGPVGAGQLTKMVNQICIAGLVEALSEGLSFARAAGLDPQAVVDVISKGAAQSWQMENRHKTMLAGHYDHGFAVEWMRKDLAICFDEASRNGAPLPVTEMVDRFYAEVEAMGGTRWDTSSLFARLEARGKK